jgi:ribonuclease R
LLRSLTQAVYSPDNIGHFGLSHEYYAHFTSPIRRYPDLVVHRALRHIISKQKADTFTYTSNELALLGQHCSMTERRADEATRDATTWLKCEYMQDKLGETFAGTITGVTSFGLFVELSDIYVEGLVHISTLADDYYHYDAAKFHLQGEQSKKTYRLGDKVNATVTKIDLDEKKMDFILAEAQPKRKKIKKTKRKHSR